MLVYIADGLRVSLLYYISVYALQQRALQVTLHPGIWDQRYPLGPSWLMNRGFPPWTNPINRGPRNQYLYLACSVCWGGVSLGMRARACTLQIEILPGGIKLYYKHGYLATFSNPQQDRKDMYL